MGFKPPMPKEHVRYHQHAKFHVPIFKTVEVIAVYSDSIRLIDLHWKE